MAEETKHGSHSISGNTDFGVEQTAQEVTKKGRLGNRNFKPYNKGDQVWIKGTNLKTPYPAKKLGPKQYRPFKVMKQLSPAVYEVALPHSWKIHNVFHANLITPYKETELHGCYITVRTFTRRGLSSVL